jgi:hypothetical protein
MSGTRKHKTGLMLTGAALMALGLAAGYHYHQKKNAPKVKE